MDLAVKIKQIREQKRMSQAEVARALELDPATYFRLEKRGKKLSIEQAEEIAEYFGISLVELLSDSDGKEIREVDILQRRVSELEGKVMELGDRLSDKQSIIDSHTRSRAKLLEQIEYAILSMGASELSLGEPHDLIDSLEARKNEPTNNLWLFPYKFSKEDYIKIVYHIYQTDQKYFYLVWRLIENGIIDSKKMFIKPFIVLSRMIWPDIESVPAPVKETMDELGLTLADLEAMARSANMTST